MAPSQMPKPLTCGCRRAGAGSEEGVGSITKASSVARLGCSGARCANLSHFTFPSEHEGSWRQTLGMEYQVSPAVGHLHPSPPPGTVSAHLWKEVVAVSQVNPAATEPSSDCCMNPNGFLVCFFLSKSIQFIEYPLVNRLRTTSTVFLLSLW